MLHSSDRFATQFLAPYQLMQTLKDKMRWSNYVWRPPQINK